MLSVSLNKNISFLPSFLCWRLVIKIFQWAHWYKLNLDWLALGRMLYHWAASCRMLYHWAASCGCPSKVCYSRNTHRSFCDAAFQSLETRKKRPYCILPAFQCWEIGSRGPFFGVEQVGGFVSGDEQVTSSSICFTLELPGTVGVPLQPKLITQILYSLQSIVTLLLARKGINLFLKQELR